MAKYKLSFTVEYGYGAEHTDSKIVETNLDPQSDEFSRFIAKEAKHMGDGDIMESIDFEDEYNLPSIEVVLIAEAPFSPKNAAKYWNEEWLEDIRLQMEAREKRDAACKRNQYESMKVENKDARPTHRLKKEYVGFGTVTIPAGEAAYVGEFNAYFLNEKFELKEYPTDYDHTKKGKISIYSELSHSDGPSRWDMHPLDEYFEEIK
ncbi:MAG: hypothetical protein ACW96X_12810 [Promethearchaeota archaeon]